MLNKYPEGSPFWSSSSSVVSAECQHVWRERVMGMKIVYKCFDSSLRDQRIRELDSVENRQTHSRKRLNFYNFPPKYICSYQNSMYWMYFTEMDVQFKLDWYRICTVARNICWWIDGSYEQSSEISHCSLLQCWLRSQSLGELLRSLSQHCPTLSCHSSPHQEHSWSL